MNVATCLNNVTPSWADLPALIDGTGQVLKRGQMQKLVLSLAQNFAASGVKSGDLIGLATLGHDQYILVTLAAAALGAVTMPLPKIDSKARSLIKKCQHIIGQLENSASADSVPTMAFPAVNALANPPASPNMKLFDAHGVFRISHSSGTTGTPKAVAITHAEQTTRLRQRAQVMPVKPGQSMLLLMGLDAEVTMTNVLLVLAQGGALIIPQGNDGQALLDTLKKTKPDYVLSSPHIWSGVIKAALEKVGDSLSQRPVVFLAGGKPDAQTIDGSQQLNAVLISDYGSSETGMLSMNQVQKMGPTWNFAGKLLSGVLCEVLDPDTFKTLPRGSVGLLTFKSPGMVSQYWDSPEDDRRFFHGGWFSNGDLGCLDEKGFLFVGTRVSRVVNRKGIKYDLDLLEQQVNQLPDIVENAWVKDSDAQNEKLTLVIVMKNSEKNLKKLKAQLHQILGERYAPDQLAFAQKLPRTQSGKIDRDRLLQTLKHSERKDSATAH